MMKSILLRNFRTLSIGKELMFRKKLMMSLKSHRKLATLPGDIRTAISEGKFSSSSNNTDCSGFLQATVNILPKELADDFHKFCHHNSSICPLLHCSEPGEVDVTFLARDPQVRTDISKYHIFKDGMFIEEFTNLESNHWKEMVTFYLTHCSSYEHLLIKAGIPIRHVEQGKNAPTYRTNIPCYPVGMFSCPILATMKPIPRDMLEKVVQITTGFMTSYGAPIHIGDPSLIGIHDLTKPFSGDWIALEQGDVPVFWGSSQTSSLAKQTAEPKLAFTHAEQCTFLTGMSLDQFHELGTRLDSAISQVKVIACQEEPHRLSIISQVALDRIRAIEKAVQEDPGGRGIKSLIVENDLEKAVLSLSHSQSVAIVTGFPCHIGYDPPFENDGVNGTIVLAKALLALHKDVTIIVDKSFVPLIRTILRRCVEAGILPRDVPVIDSGFSGLCDHSSSSSLQSLAGEFLFPKNLQGLPRFDHLLAIERAGPGASGQYCTMRGIDITAACDPVDVLFDYAFNNRNICTIGVGDGGNEVGMGKVFEKVKQHIPLGEKIACRTPTNHLITAGVSDWGGFGIAAGLYEAIACKEHERYSRRGIGIPRKIEKDEVLLTVEKAEELLGILGQNGLRCGMTKSTDYMVDGMPFWPTHADKIKQIRNPQLLDQ